MARNVEKQWINVYPRLLIASVDIEDSNIEVYRIIDTMLFLRAARN